MKVGQSHGAIGHRHLPGTDHLVAVAQAAHAAIANRDQKAFGRHCRMRQHVGDGLLQAYARQIQGGKLALHGLHVAVHFGRLAQQHIHGHVHW